QPRAAELLGAFRAREKLPVPVFGGYSRGGQGFPAGVSRSYGSLPAASLQRGRRTNAGQRALTDNVRLVEWPALENALEAERRQIERVKTSMQDELGEAPSSRRRLLHTVAGEAIGEQQVGQGGMRAGDRVAVEEIP